MPVGTKGGRGAIAPQIFGRLVNTIPTRGQNNALLILACPHGFLDLSYGPGSFVAVSCFIVKPMNKVRISADLHSPFSAFSFQFLLYKVLN